ncbi:MAG: DNA-binding protein [Solobacterium sp.]|nr:DNA-binding protein [Solobacterium sp.]
MEYQKFKDCIVLRLDPKDEIVTCIKELCEKEKIHCASIEGIGATDDFEIGAYHLESKSFQGNVFHFPAEITSLIGNVTRQEKEVYLHLHMTVADEKGNAFGGHLKYAVINCTGEIILRVIDGKVHRKKDEQTGLNIFAFENTI